MIGGATLTAAALGLGIAYWIRGQNAGDDVTTLGEQLDAQRTRCSDSLNAMPGTCRDLQEAADRKESSNRIANISFVAAGVLGAVTIALPFVWKTDASPTRATISVSPFARTLSIAGAF